MKESLLKGHEAPINKTEIVAQFNKQVERRYIGSMRIKPGHKLFVLSPDDLMIDTVTEFEETTAAWNTTGSKIIGNKRKVHMKDGHLYVSALNAQNARKKFLKMMGLI